MNNSGTNTMVKSEVQVNIEGTHILEKELATLQFSVWDVNAQKGHSEFIGNAVETAQFLEQHDLDNLEVSALDLEYMHSLGPVSALQWIYWYYETALSKLEQNDFDEGVLVPYPTKY